MHRTRNWIIRLVALRFWWKAVLRKSQGKIPRVNFLFSLELVSNHSQRVVSNYDAELYQLAL